MKIAPRTSSQHFLGLILEAYGADIAAIILSTKWIFTHFFCVGIFH